MSAGRVKLEQESVPPGTKAEVAAFLAKRGCDALERIVKPTLGSMKMLASQMAVTHALAMDMLGRAKRAGLIDHLHAYGALATKLLRTYTMQTEALAKLKHGGGQTVRIDRVHVYHGGQAIVGAVSNQRSGGGLVDERARQADGATREPSPFRLAPRCLARTRAGTSCQKAAATAKKRCRMHGGAPGSGAPRGERNGNYRTGLHTSEATAGRRMILALIKGFQGALS
jgi:hypothetical protein